jgi:acyl-CoA synthetase (AMP-forming)/AMP-acid ligase II
MKEGRDQWLQPLLDQASDNVAEIMDAEDPLFILYTSGSTENQKEWYTGRVIWCILPIRLRMFLIMKTMIFSGVPLMVDYRTFLYSLRTVIEWSYNGNFRRRSILSRFQSFLANHRIKKLPSLHGTNSH